MDSIALLLVLVILILILVRTGRISQQLRTMEAQFRELRRQITTSSLPVAKRASETEAIKETEPLQKPAPTPIERWAPNTETEDADAQKEQPAAVLKPAAIPQPVIVAPPPAYVPPPSPPKPGFFERNPDLEKFIGENLVSKIGIAILVIGIGFFVKYAIDNNWVGVAGRVCIGLLCGGILTGLAHRLQKSYPAFSSVLIGGGLSVFYFTIGLAYHQYQLFSQPAAFAIMVVITVFAVLLSLLYDRQEVAIIALTGGFAVPFMVSNGSGNYVALFTYLLLLNIGILIIAYRKGWRLLNGLSFIYTIILFGSWLFSLHYPVVPSVCRNGFLFATAFYLLYLGINLAHNIRGQRRFIAADFGILLANTALYFSAGLYLFYLGNAGEYKGIFAAAMGVLNLCLSYYLFRNKQVDKNIFYLLTGITLTFVSITAPLQLHGHFITLFWASEAVVLWWLLQQSGIKLLRISFIAVWGLTLISLVMDWAKIYSYNDVVIPVIINRGLMTSVFVLLSNTALHRLMLRYRDEEKSGWLPGPVLYGITALVLGLITGLLEINYQFSTRHPGARLPGLYLPLYAMSYGLAAQYFLRKRESAPRMMQPLISAACLLLYLIVLRQHTVFSQVVTTVHRNGGHLFAHWLMVVLVVAAVYQLSRFCRAATDPFSHTAGAWILSAFSVLLVSWETYLFLSLLMAHDYPSLERFTRNYVRVGLPIIWGLCSFTLMYLGFRHKARMLRIIALTLFGITLVKLFLYDISDLAPAGKIAAFICLGILLLVVSFMYQRLKKIIVSDEVQQDPK